MLPEKPWSRWHIDHAINFLGFNWLVVTDAYTKYPCIHATQSVSAKSTIKLLQEDFAHFGFPHTVVTACAATFKSDEFQEFCKENGIVHLTGAPYHPATNGAAERLVKTFKQSLEKLDKAPKDALQGPASCLTDVKSVLKLTPYCLHLLTLHRANKLKKLRSLNSLSVSSPWVVQYHSFSYIVFQGNFCKITLTPFHLFLKIKKSHGNTGF